MTMNTNKPVKQFSELTRKELEELAKKQALRARKKNYDMLSEVRCVWPEAAGCSLTNGRKHHGPLSECTGQGMGRKIWPNN